MAPEGAPPAPDPRAEIAGPDVAGAGVATLDVPRPDVARPQVWPAFVGFGAAVMIAQILGTLVLGALFFGQRLMSGAPLVADPGEMLGDLMRFVTSRTSLIAAGTVTSLTLLGSALVGARLSKTPAAVRLRLGPSRLGWGRTAVAAAGAVAVSWGYSSLIPLTGLDGIGMIHLFDKAFEDATPGFLALAVLVIGLSAPIGEELFFRGFVQTRLSQRWTRWAAIVTTALAFGLIHMDLIQSPFAVLAGLYLGWLTEIAGSVRPAVVAHVANNTLSVLMPRDGGPPSQTTHLVSLAISIVVVVAALLALRSARPREAAGAAAAG